MMRRERFQLKKAPQQPLQPKINQNNYMEPNNNSVSRISEGTLNDSIRKEMEGKAYLKLKYLQRGADNSLNADNDQLTVSQKVTQQMMTSMQNSLQEMKKLRELKNLNPTVNLGEIQNFFRERNQGG